MELCSTERDHDVALKTVNQEVVIKNTVFLWSHHFLQKTQKFTVTLIEICSTEHLALKTVNQEVVKKVTVFSKHITSYKKMAKIYSYVYKKLIKFVQTRVNTVQSNEVQNHKEHKGKL